MSAGPVQFRTGAVNPIYCFKTGWQYIKDQYWIFLGVTFVGIILGSVVPFGIIMGPMMCGIYLCYLHKMRGGRISFDMLFKGFDYFVQSLIATIILVVPMLIIMVPVNLSLTTRLMKLMQNMPQDPNQNDEVMIQFMKEYFVTLFTILGVIFLLSMIIGILFIFTYFLIVDRGLSGIDALKTSYKAGIANMGGLLGLILINMVLGIIGVTCCYVGAFFVMPISFAAFTIAYFEVFGEKA